VNRLATVDGHAFEVRSSLLGKETVRHDAAIVSEKYSVGSGTHSFSVKKRVASPLTTKCDFAVRGMGCRSP